MRKLLLLAAFVPTLAMAHTSPSGQVYDGFCCNGNRVNGDCQPIPSASVTITANGEYQITLRPGDHWMVTEVRVFTKKITETRQSTDGQFHACLWPTEETLRCLYVPPLGS